MKKNFRNLWSVFLGTTLLLFLALSLNVSNINATNNFTSKLAPSKSKVQAGETFTVNIVLSGLDSNGLGSANYNVGFNDSLFTYASHTTPIGATMVDNLDGNVVKLGFFTANAVGNGILTTLTFTAKSTAVGSGDFTLSSSGAGVLVGSDVIPLTSSDSGTSVTAFILGTNANLASLSLSAGSLSPTFNAETTSYTATVDASSVVINATTVTGATLTGIGTKNLNYGNNSFYLIVTAEDGVTKKTYSITINRPDNRSSNNKLKELAVSNTDIKFNGGTSYTSTVENNITSVNISATASDSRSTISGAGKKDLQVGSNVYQLIVTAENGSQQIYVITIIRKPKSGEELNLSKINTLESLSIEGVSLDFDSKKLVYNLSVENNISEVKLKYKLSDTKSSAVVEGKTQLEVGVNKISIIVTAENGETKIYVLYIERKPVRTVVESDDEKIIAEINDKNGTPQIFISVTEASQNKVVSVEVLKQLASSGKTLIYEIVNNGGGTIYSVTINGSKLDAVNNPFDFTITFKSNYSAVLKTLAGDKKHLPINIKHNGKLPAGISIKIFVSDKFTSTSILLYLYYFNTETNKLELVQKDVKVINGYIELQLDHASEYVLLESVLGHASKNFTWTRLVNSAIVGVITIAGLVAFIVKQKKKPKTTNDEDLAFNQPTPTGVTASEFSITEEKDTTADEQPPTWSGF